MDIKAQLKQIQDKVLYRASADSVRRKTIYLYQ